MAAPGICQYCGLTQAEVEASESLGWHDLRRNCCTKYACLKQHFDTQRQMYRRIAKAQRARRKESRLRKKGKKS